MTQMIVRPPQFWLNPFGSFAEEFKVFIGKPNQDPTQALSQLTVTDGKTGAIVNQPIIVSEGITRNTSGQQILPVINTQQYAIYYQSPNGETVYSEADFFGDGLEGGGGTGAGIAELVINNLQQALAEDLDGFNYIYIKSTNPGWEGTEAGPDINSVYYYTGQTGAPGTGDKNVFYDAQGNEWEIVDNITQQDNVFSGSNSFTGDIGVWEYQVDTTPQSFNSSGGFAEFPVVFGSDGYFEYEYIASISTVSGSGGISTSSRPRSDAAFTVTHAASISISQGDASDIDSRVSNANNTVEAAVQVGITSVGGRASITAKGIIFFSQSNAANGISLTVSGSGSLTGTVEGASIKTRKIPNTNIT